MQPILRFEECDVDRKCYKIIKTLGRGNFGDVYLAKIKTVYVAVKTCRTNYSRESLIEEAKKMFHLNHPKLVRFMGICSMPETEPVWLITEYMANGSLKEFLQNPDNRNLTYHQLITMIDEVTQAMVFLEETEVVHRDLRAANVLVANDKSVKVADFGLSKIISINGDMTLGSNPFPTRSTPPEVAEPGYVPSTSADVWSYGVLIYETLTFGSEPYSELEKSQVMSYLRTGNRLPNPTTLNYKCDEQIYQLMRKCWREDPKLRPTFKMVHEELKVYIEEIFGKVYCVNEAQYLED